MKKHNFTLVLMSLVCILGLPAVMHAQTSSGIDTIIDVPESSNQSVRDRIRADYQSRIQNMRTNQDLRNIELENRLSSSTKHFGSTTNDFEPRPNGSSTRMTNPREHVKPSPLASSTTPRYGYENDGNGMRTETFHARQDVVVGQLQLSLDNLKNVRSRIDTRIQKAQASGRDMTTAISLLAIADSKILIAQNAINSLDNIQASSSTATSTIIDLGKPRQIAAGTIQAIRDVQKALNDVVVAIAQSMGYKIGKDGNIISQ